MNFLQIFAQDTLSEPMSYTYDSPAYTSNGPEGYYGVVIIICIIAYILQGIALWKVFGKANKPRWAGFVPIYNFITLLQVAGRPVWWALFLLLIPIPFVGFIAAIALLIIISNDISKSFGRDIGTTVLLVLLPLIGYFILGYGSATYRGPAALQADGHHDDSTPPTTPVV
jgi:hypothetical protein